MGIGRFAFTPLLPMMQADSGLSLAAGGWLASANYLGYLFGALSAGFFPRSGKVIRVGLLVIAGATLAMGLTHQLAVWAVLRLAAGMASAWVLVHVSAWCLPRLMGRTTLAGAVYAGVGVGIVVAGALCAMLMAWSAPSSQTWIVLGGICLLPAFLLWREFVPDGSARSPAAGRWNARWWPLVLCYGAFGFGYIIPATFLPAWHAVKSPIRRCSAGPGRPLAPPRRHPPFLRPCIQNTSVIACYGRSPSWSWHSASSRRWRCTASPASSSRRSASAAASWSSR